MVRIRPNLGDLGGGAWPSSTRLGPSLISECRILGRLAFGQMCGNLEPFRPSSGQIRPMPVKRGLSERRPRAKCGQRWPKFGRLWPKLGRTRQNLGWPPQNSAKHDQTWPPCGQFWENAGQLGPNVGQLRPTSSRDLARRQRLGRDRPKLGQIVGRHFGRFRSKSVQHRPNSGRC